MPNPHTFTGDPIILETLKIWKCCNKDFLLIYIFRQSLQLFKTYFIYYTAICNGFYHIKPSLISPNREQQQASYRLESYQSLNL